MWERIGKKNPTGESQQISQPRDRRSVKFKAHVMTNDIGFCGFLRLNLGAVVH